MRNSTIIEFEIKILETSVQYNEKSKDIIIFEAYNNYLNIIVSYLEENDIKKILNNPQLNQFSYTYNDYKSVLNDIEKSNKGYYTINIESIYKLNFQNFEEFLYEII